MVWQTENGEFMAGELAPRPGRVEVLPSAHTTDVQLPERLGGFTLREVQTIGNIAAEAGMFRGLTPAQSFIKILAALELNVPMIQALGGIDVVKGNVQMRSAMMANLLKRTGRYRYKCTRWDAEACELVWYEKVDGAWEEVGPSSFTIEEARDAGLVKGDSAWAHYPKAMLMARAVSQGAKAWCADALGGAVYAEGEVPEDMTYEEHAELVNRPRRETVEVSPALDAPDPTAGAPAPAAATAPPPVEPNRTGAGTDDGTSSAPAGEPTPEAPASGKAEAHDGPANEPPQAPLQSLVEIIGKTPLDKTARQVTAKQLEHLRKVAKPLDSAALDRVVQWATRNDEQPQAVAAGLKDARYAELRHFFENAEQSDLEMLVMLVQAWESEGTSDAAPEVEGQESLDV